MSTFSAMNANSLDATHFYAVVSAGDGMYKVGVYNSDGTLLKELVTLDSQRCYINPLYGYNADNTRTIYGYSASWTDSDGNDVYFDTDFNQTSVRPANSSSSARALSLEDGTVVNVSHSGGWDSTNTVYTYTATVADSEGNASPYEYADGVILRVADALRNSFRSVERAVEYEYQRHDDIGQEADPPRELAAGVVEGLSNRLSVLAHAQF